MVALAFGIVAALALLSALAVVRSRDLVHAVLWLGVALFSTAVLYAMLGASFIAGVQVLLYVGGVVTLMIFGVMITRRHGGAPGGRERGVGLESAGSPRAAVVALALFGSTAWAVLETDGLDAPAPTGTASAADLGRVLLHEHLLAFEAVSMLLLAAMIGAIVIARRSDPGAAKQPGRQPPATVETTAEGTAQ